MGTRILRADTDEQWVAWAADEFLAAANRAVGERGEFHVVMAGGSTPRAVLERVDVSVAEVWAGTHVYFSDERGVPEDHEESNYRMVREAWLDRVAIPADQVHRIPGELPLEEAARAYNRVLERLLGDGDEDGGGDGRPFDLVVLGLGTDGHTASLAPGVPLDHVAEPWVGVGPAPLSPARARRVTLTAAALRRTRATHFWVRGNAKADVVRAALRGDVGATVVPDVIAGVPEVTWILDGGAAAQV